VLQGVMLVMAHLVNIIIKSHFFFSDNYAESVFPRNRLVVVIAIALLALCIVLLFGLFARSKPVIKIGILHSLTAHGC